MIVRFMTMHIVNWCWPMAAKWVNHLSPQRLEIRISIILTQFALARLVAVQLPFPASWLLGLIAVGLYVFMHLIE